MAIQLSELLCRVCLKPEEVLVDIYEHVEEQNADLSTLLGRCSDIQVDRQDAFPKFLCQECTEELLTVVKFRAKCVATEQTLKAMQGREEVAAAASISEVVEEELVIDDDGNALTVEDIIEYDESESLEYDQDSEGILPSKPTTKSFSCDSCGAVFQQIATLQRHIAKSHTDESSFTCLECGQVFTKETNLEAHNCCLTSEPRATTRRYCCTYCGKRLQSPSSLAMHLRLHNGEQPFVCDSCPKAFKTKAALSTHQKRHLGLMDFKCEYCGKGFVESSNLQRHIASLHTALRPHTCITCQRSFSRVYLLELHKRTHTGERPYSCAVCKRSFAQLSVLRNHERIHTGERRHRCEICKKTFSRLNQLKKHQLKSCLTNAQSSSEVVNFIEQQDL
ncbi:CG7963 [Drosophila busckii]|uniref:CG7963 n=1 Tax=Drosophila busckii TaxID=30019 RepID=A0A0M4EKL0_DROBS|nr:zinc finger protein 664 [Drosophila busckii]ALC47758.1 CG7963 [Drosophila busckii]